MLRPVALHLGALASLALIASQSGPVHAAQRFDGIWIVKQDNLQGCAFTPPPYPIRIAKGALVGIDGTVSPSGKITGSGTNRLGNRFLFSGQLRGRSGTGSLIVFGPGTQCRGTFTMRRR